MSVMMCLRSSETFERSISEEITKQCTNMSTPNSEVIMFTPIPKPDELIQIQAEVTKPVTQGYQWIIMKCRLLIFSESDIIASPAVGSSKQIHIISSRHFFNKGKLQTLLLRHNMEGKEAEPVSKEIYESCLHYSILARLSPLWNYVEPFLIQGVNFLTETRIMNAVKIQIVINAMERVRYQTIITLFFDKKLKAFKS